MNMLTTPLRHALAALMECGAGPLFGVTVNLGQSGDYLLWVLKFNVDGVSRRKLDLAGIGGVLAMIGGNLDVFSEGVVMRDSDDGFEDLLSLFLG